MESKPFKIEHYISQKRNKKGVRRPLPVVNDFPLRAHNSYYECPDCNFKMHLEWDGNEFINPKILGNTEKHSHQPREYPMKNWQKNKIIEECFKSDPLLKTEKVKEKIASVDKESSLDRKIERKRVDVLQNIVKDIKDETVNYYRQSENVVVFCNKEKIKTMKERQVGFVMMDGTFHSAPKGWYQLYTIHVMLSNGSTFVLMHSLLKGKSEAVYDELFRIVNEITMDAWGKKLLAENTSCLIDFELAVFNCLIRLKVSIHGCLFHFRQCLFRKICNLGLKGEYMGNEGFRMVIHRIMNLCYLKERDIVEQYNIIKNNALNGEFGFSKEVNDKLILFFNYFDDTWMDKWPIEMWSCYVQTIRTDNNSEAYHSALAKRLSSEKPSFDELLLHWNTIETREKTRINGMKEGNNKKFGNGKNWNDIKRIINIINSYYSGSILIEELFESLNKILSNKLSKNTFEVEGECSDGTIPQKVVSVQSKKIRTRNQSKSTFIEDVRKNGEKLQKSYKKKVTEKTSKTSSGIRLTKKRTIKK